MDRKSKIAGCLFGGAIGDALGYQIEWEKDVPERFVISYKDNFGRISDDTQMTLFTAEGLLYYLDHRDKSSVSDCLYEAYKCWYRCQTGQSSESKLKNKLLNLKFKKTDNPLNLKLFYEPVMWERRGPGNTCLTSLGSNKKGTLAFPINQSRGCGSVMRLSPCGIVFSDPKISAYNAAVSGAITHGHDDSNVACYFLGALINILINNDISILSATHKSLELTQKQDFFDKSSTESFCDLVLKVIELANSNKRDGECIKELGEGWVADEAVAIALYSALRHFRSFGETLICAVNHNGDSDSTGAIAGNIVGASLGEEEIPCEWLDNLEVKEIVSKIVNRLNSVSAI